MIIPNKHLITTNNDNIYIYDNIVPFHNRQFIYNFVINSNYITTTTDNKFTDIKKSCNMASVWNSQDLENSQFLEIPTIKELINTHCQDYSINQTRVNLSSIGDFNNFHLDYINGKTLLYYVNHEWDLKWGGLTLFADNTGKKLEYAVDYVPGRVVIFDGRIPHSVQNPTITAESWRYTLAIQFDKDK